MGLFDLFKGHESAPSIDERVEEARKTPGALLVDVREPDEFDSGHIPGALSVPLSQLENAGGDPTSLHAFLSPVVPLYVYCKSGMRARRTKDELEKAGYRNVFAIGGIEDWHGPIER